MNAIVAPEAASSIYDMNVLAPFDALFDEKSWEVMVKVDVAHAE